MDWVAHWRALVEGRETQTRRLRGETALRATPEFWDERAEAYRQGAQRRTGEVDFVLEAMAPYLTPDSTVFDIGAGAGRYTLPLAQQVRRVVAVEPAPNMREFLAQDAAAQGLTNITIAPGIWEKAVVEPCDLALCVNVAYFVVDIAAFLEKLASYTRKRCFMVLRSRSSNAHLGRLWRAVHGEELVPETTAQDLVNALQQVLGVLPSLQMMPPRPGRTTSYDSLDELVAQIGRQLSVSPGSQQEAALRDQLQARLKPAPDGRWTWQTPPVGLVVLSWENSPESWNRTRFPGEDS